MSPEHPHTRPDVSADVFGHRRREDGEHVGYIEMRPDGSFVPYDLLWTPRGKDLELDETESILDEIGLRLLAQDWLLADDADTDDGTTWVPVRIKEIHRDRVVVARVADELSGSVAKAITWAGAVELELPTTHLRPAR